ncbi:MAG: hypothetical protein KKF26_04510, partial [Chloroflexi bacterium]|nr:hypothetical protein [Chloroflexota bacterium]
VNRVSPQTALFGEIQEVNKICRLAREPNLFRESFPDYNNLTAEEWQAESIDERRHIIDNMRAQLGRLTKPTAAQFRYFILELDKILSQNLNKEFFAGKLELNESNGKGKGTRKLLKEYLNNIIGVPEDVSNEIYNSLKKVSDERITPAHRITENKFNPTYWDMQLDILKNSVKSIRKLRKVFTEHFDIQNYSSPEWLDEARIE